MQTHKRAWLCLDCSATPSEIWLEELMRCSLTAVGLLWCDGFSEIKWKWFEPLLSVSLPAENSPGSCVHRNMRSQAAVTDTLSLSFFLSYRCLSLEMSSCEYWLVIINASDNPCLENREPINCCSGPQDKRFNFVMWTVLKWISVFGLRK